MTKASTILVKMQTSLDNEEVKYHLKANNEFIHVNNLIGEEISIEFTGKLQCLDCQKVVKKFYGQGLCYVCSQSSVMNSPCIIHPELCEAHLGKGRDVEWEKQQHFQPHIVYLAYSGSVKVGVTRADQMPTRWLDQGATHSMILANVPYRRLAGEIEVILKNHFSDKTNWRKMLKHEQVIEVDFDDEWDRAIEIIKNEKPEYYEYMSEDKSVNFFNFPTQTLTESVKSNRLEKVLGLKGTLTGIKGQYLIFDHKNVINIRNHSGYEVEIEY